MDIIFLRKINMQLINFLGQDGIFFRTRFSISQDELAIPELWDNLVTFLGRDGHRLTNSAM